MEKESNMEAFIVQVADTEADAVEIQRKAALYCMVQGSVFKMLIEIMSHEYPGMLRGPLGGGLVALGEGLKLYSNGIAAWLKAHGLKPKQVAKEEAKKALVSALEDDDLDMPAEIKEKIKAAILREDSKEIAEEWPDTIVLPGDGTIH